MPIYTEDLKVVRDASGAVSVDQLILPRITDYWDPLGNNIDRFTEQLGGVEEEELSSILDALRDAVLKHISVLPKTHLGEVVVIMADDLYKTMSMAVDCPDITQRYLQATASTLLAAATEQGYLLHYIVDNVFEEFGRPVGVYPLWFRASGLVYLCPQAVALTLMQTDKPDIQYPEYMANIGHFITEARDVAAKAVSRCDEESRPYVFLDADAAPNSFDTYLARRNDPGVITVFRNDPPVAGSHIAVLGPPEIRDRFSPAGRVGESDASDDGAIKAEAKTTSSGIEAVADTPQGSDPLLRRLVDWLIRQDDVLSVVTIDNRRAIADLVHAEVEIELKPKDQGS